MIKYWLRRGGIYKNSAQQRAQIKIASRYDTRFIYDVNQSLKRGKYASVYAEAHNIVLLDPEVAKAFPSEEAVNKALLSLMKEAQTSEELTKNSNKR